MFMTVAATFGLIVWIVIWALTQHGMIAFIPCAAILLTAATIKVLLQYLPNQRGQ